MEKKKIKKRKKRKMQNGQKGEPLNKEKENSHEISPFILFCKDLV